MVTDAVWVTGPMNAPMMATSVSSTYVAVTVTTPPPTEVDITTGRSTERAAASAAAPAASVVTDGGAGALPGGQLHDEFVAEREPDLDDAEHGDQDHRQDDRELDRRLARLAPGGASRACGSRHTRSIALSSTRLKSRPTRSAPPPAVAQATTSKPDERGGEQHERVLGRGLPTFAVQPEPAAVGGA